MSSCARLDIAFTLTNAGMDWSVKEFFDESILFKVRLETIMVKSSNTKPITKNIISFFPIPNSVICIAID